MIWVIVLLIIVSGIIALIGDYLGYRIGKRRLSIFGLRPRYTAVTITIISGILITTITLTTVVILSREARLALFGLEELKHKIVSLEKVKNNLETEIEVRRKGSVLFKNKEVILNTLLARGMDKQAAEAKIKQIIGFLDLYVRNLGVKEGKESLILITNDAFNKAVSKLSSAKLDQVLRVKVQRNVIFGERVPISFIFTDNKKLFYSGQVIARTYISSSLSDARIERELQALLSKARTVAEKKGIIPSASGSVGTIAYADIFNVVQGIKAQERNVLVKVIADRTIYTIGPLNVRFKI